MKHLFKVIIVLFAGIFLSCEKSSLENTVEALILQHTCGGTVIKFTSLDFGESWINSFDDSQTYNNVALTVDLNPQDFKEGDVVTFSFKETNQLKGNTCNIGGLPETKIEMQGIRKKNELTKLKEQLPTTYKNNA